MVCVAFRRKGRAIHGYIFVETGQEYQPRDELESAVAKSYTRGKGYIVRCRVPVVGEDLIKRGYGYVLFEHGKPVAVGTDPNTLSKLATTLQYIMPVFYVVESEYGIVKRVGAQQ